MAARIYYADLWGWREDKYQALAESDIAVTDWVELKPSSPFYLFVPLQEDLLAEYETGWKVTDVFPQWVLGIQTHRDRLAVAFGFEEMRERLLEFCDADRSDSEVSEALHLSGTGSWSLSEARTRLRHEHVDSNLIRQYAYRPFDVRYVYYSPIVVDRLRPKVMQALLKPGGLGLCTVRQTHGPKWGHAFVTRLPTDAFINEIKDGSSVFPLYLYPSEGQMQFEEVRHPNLNPNFVTAFSAKLGLEFVSDGKGALKGAFGREDVFNYAYAVFHSSTYRSRYAEFLKIDFPRLPLTSDKELFKSLVAKGAELVSLHLLESPLLNSFITKYPIAGSNEVERVTYDDNTQRVCINKTQYFEGVPPDVWDFHIGGYQVCQKWLKDRKGRALTYDELTHYQKVVVAIKETIRLMAEIDDLIPGWRIE